MGNHFFFVLGFVILLNIVWYVISDRWLRNDLSNYPKARYLTRLSLFFWFSVVFLPIMATLIPGLGNPLNYGPWLWLVVFYLWMGAIFFWMLAMIFLGIPIWAIGKVFKSNKNAVPQSPDQNEKGLSRRQLLRLALVAAPPLLVSGGSAVAIWNRERLNVYTKDLPVMGLPTDLHGFTITQLSDIHIGLLTGRERVDNIIAAANSLNSQITVVTGDILDRELDYMPDLLDTIGALKAPLGTYLCIGNHDKIYDAQEFVTTVRKAGLNLLLDEAVVLDTGQTPIKLLGVDYARQEYMYDAHIKKADQSLSAPENALKILLAHHPHAFDYANSLGIPITLAGHTHGGQMVLKASERVHIFNPGRYLFRYVDGIYRSDQGNTLFVHRGSGDWFPLRMGVPCEVVQLRLVPA